MLNLFSILKSARARKARSNSPIVKAGFTLIELSIVLVIIGLIVGGVLVGNDLIKAAEIRSQIQQIEKYNVAVNTFKEKYGYLPEDIPEPHASGFGFASRGTLAGQGDGNGTISAYATFELGTFQQGETGMVWVDLSTANLLNENFNKSGLITNWGFCNSSGNDCLPRAKIGQGNFVYVWSDSSSNASWIPIKNSKIMYFGLSAITIVGSGSYTQSDPMLKVNQAQIIDQKIDDSLPQSGAVVALYSDRTRFSNRMTGWAGTNITGGTPYTTATPASETTCFDNGNVAGATQKYSVGTNSGNGINCALSFKFQ